MVEAFVAGWPSYQAGMTVGMVQAEQNDAMTIGGEVNGVKLSDLVWAPQARQL